MVLKVELELEAENKFRETAMRRFGYSKGSLKHALQEALSYWVSEHSDAVPKSNEPFTLVEGALKHLRGKKDSVQLQHEARGLWTQKYS